MALEKALSRSAYQPPPQEAGNDACIFEHPRGRVTARTSVPEGQGVGRRGLGAVTFPKARSARAGSRGRAGVEAEPCCFSQKRQPKSPATARGNAGACSQQGLPSPDPRPPSQNASE